MRTGGAYEHKYLVLLSMFTRTTMSAYQLIILKYIVSPCSNDSQWLQFAGVRITNNPTQARPEWPRLAPSEISWYQDSTSESRT